MVGEGPEREADAAKPGVPPAFDRTVPVPLGQRQALPTGTVVKVGTHSWLSALGGGAGGPGEAARHHVSATPPLTTLGQAQDVSRADADEPRVSVGTTDPGQQGRMAPATLRPPEQ